MSKKILLSIILLSVFNAAYGQIGINTPTPQSTLDINAINPAGAFTNTDGILIPRVDRQRAQNMGTVEISTIIYINDYTTGSQTGKAQNIDANGFYYYNGSVWEKINKTLLSYPIGSITQSFKTADYSGWYLLNGRAISTLPVAAQAAAASLGLTTNLFDATDRTLKTKNTTENIGETGGSNSFAILQSNLPNINLTTTVSGTALSSGAHTHNSDTGGSFLYGGTSAGNNGTGHGGAVSPTLFGGVGIGITGASGNHTHTFTGTTSTTLGSGQSINNRSAYVVVNSFIYLGE
ncbi:hypothetical protein SAMN05421664_3285 [Chryseobacterium soldanellicola]|uniref:Microcystin-dependent protein n=1 Tax=Chryseobacterium soldanellicola TaxID=311333 RepID=A0A1H1FV73_9FLAO|nr:hypothetical protein [Chryseobacterium soldanellicola]SDR04867.1 hypothetical protein SAMN05421664_3285 [Chryseobacterium soldanellicola]